MTSETNWPLVAVNDHGIRPAGLPDQCFYCHQKVGSPHARDCVVVWKLARLEVELTCDVEIPHCQPLEEIRRGFFEDLKDLLDDFMVWQEGRSRLRELNLKSVRVIDKTPTRTLKHDAET
jgi:hypothetical protein